MEELIALILIVLTLLIIFCLYKMLDKRGLYFSLVIMDLIAFVLSFKITYVFKKSEQIVHSFYLLFVLLEELFLLLVFLVELDFLDCLVLDFESQDFLVFAIIPPTFIDRRWIII